MKVYYSSKLYDIFLLYPTWHHHVLFEVVHRTKMIMWSRRLKIPSFYIKRKELQKKYVFPLMRFYMSSEQSKRKN